MGTTDLTEDGEGGVVLEFSFQENRYCSERLCIMIIVTFVCSVAFARQSKTLLIETISSGLTPHWAGWMMSDVGSFASSAVMHTYDSMNIPP